MIILNNNTYYFTDTLLVVISSIVLQGTRSLDRTSQFCFPLAASILLFADIFDKPSFLLLGFRQLQNYFMFPTADLRFHHTNMDVFYPTFNSGHSLDYSFNTVICRITGTARSRSNKWACITFRLLIIMYLHRDDLLYLYLYHDFYPYHDYYDDVTWLYVCTWYRRLT